jgi:uncharacterized membrane protein YdbT with pleckstrin-like domain
MDRLAATATTRVVRRRPATVIRQGAPVASTDPIGLQAPVSITVPIANHPQPEPMLLHGDVGRVRLYVRLAAALHALMMVLMAFVVAWVATLVFDAHWRALEIAVPLAAVAIIAAVRYLLAELRLSTYRLDLTANAVIFEYGRRRSYVPREHIQLFDTESSILLRFFGLRHCNLHTGGGVVILSPVPARITTAIERLVYEQRAVTRADQTDAVS